MANTSKTNGFEIGVKVENARGAWVILRAYPHTSNMYPVFGFDHWSPTFAPEIMVAESVTNKSRAFVERQMRTWLRNR